MAQEHGNTPEEILVQSFRVSPFHVLQATAHQAGMRAVDLEKHPPRPEALGALPAELIRRYRILPIAVVDGRLVIAFGSAPIAPDTWEEVREAAGTPIHAVLALENQIIDYLERNYP